MKLWRVADLQQALNEGQLLDLGRADSGTSWHPTGGLDPPTLLRSRFEPARQRQALPPPSGLESRCGAQPLRKDHVSPAHHGLRRAKDEGDQYWKSTRPTCSRSFTPIASAYQKSYSWGAAEPLFLCCCGGNIHTTEMGTYSVRALLFLER